MSVDSSSVQWWPEFSSAPGESPPRRCDGEKRRSSGDRYALGVERTGRRSSPPTPPTGSHHDRAPTTGSAALIQARNILSFLSSTSRASGENCIASSLPQGGLCSVEPQLESPTTSRLTCCAGWRPHEPDRPLDGSATG